MQNTKWKPSKWPKWQNSTQSGHTDIVLWDENVEMNSIITLFLCKQSMEKLFLATNSDLRPRIIAKITAQYNLRRDPFSCYRPSTASWWWRRRRENFCTSPTTRQSTLDTRWWEKDCQTRSQCHKQIYAKHSDWLQRVPWLF